MVSRPLLLGHRGARADRSIPENTFASFDRALADGCDGFEFDVRLTADKAVIVCHDPKAGKIKIAKAKAEELPALPQLQDVLQRYHERAFLDIELKIAGAEKATADFLRQFPPRGGFVVSSFVPGVLRLMQTENSEIPLGLICETKTQLARWRKLPVQYVIARQDLVGQNLVGQNLVGQNLVRELKDAGKKLLVWTVNEPAEMKRLAEWGVDGIISDDPKLLVQTLAH
jgi:glycerophosphoryl diester phosphodiesterase